MHYYQRFAEHDKARKQVQQMRPVHILDLLSYCAVAADVALHNGENLLISSWSG